MGHAQLCEDREACLSVQGTMILLGDTCPLIDMTVSIRREKARVVNEGARYWKAKSSICCLDYFVYPSMLIPHTALDYVSGWPLRQFLSLSTPLVVGLSHVYNAFLLISSEFSM